MRLKWLLTLAFAVGLATCSEEEQQESCCDPGTELFCRCRGGTSGTKLCLDSGAHAGSCTTSDFGPCASPEGECTEIPEPEPTTTTESGPGGGIDPAGPGGAGGGSSCAHDLCELGPGLDPSCDPCVMQICVTDEKNDPFCCSKVGDLCKMEPCWDDICVSEVTSICKIPCGAGGSGGTGGTGGTGGAGGSGGSGGTGGGSNCYTVSELIAGDLVITEIMNDPSAVADDKGEWFEVLNTSVPPKCIDLKGVVINSQNDTGHTVAASVIVGVDGYAVIGRSTTNNGYVPVDYAYGAALALGNGADSLSLVAGTKTIDATAYDGIGLNPVGASRTLDPFALDAAKNDDDTNWCEATSPIPGSTDYGTPGTANDACTI